MDETPAEPPTPDEPKGSGDGGTDYSKLGGLQHLFQAIFEAGVQANKLIEKRSLEFFKKLYLDDEGKPRTTKINDQEIANMVLVNHQSLTIEELEIEFEIALGGLQQGDEDEEEVNREVSVDVAGNHSGRKMASCRIKFKGGDPPEGIASITTSLVKQIKE